jgi:broad specificity phosphatase PhoE
VTTLFLIRHAENPANLTNEFSHRKVDYSLTPKGILQARQTAEYLSMRSIQHIYSSPLKRARETAEIIANRLGLPVTVIENFREVNVGDLEGQPPSPELWQQHDAIIDAWRNGQPSLCFPGGENYYELLGRARAGLNEILSVSAAPPPVPPARIALVGHGGQFTFTMLDLFPGLNLRDVVGKSLKNCSVTELELEQMNGLLHARMIQHGSCDHLSGEGSTNGKDRK